MNTGGKVIDLNREVIGLDDFELTDKCFQQLKNELKAGKIVRNPFAKFYNNGSITDIKSDSQPPAAYTDSS